MNDVELWLRPSVRNQLRFLIGIAVGSLMLLAAGLLRADDASLDPIPAAAANGRSPIFVSPISPFDPAEGTAGAHAVQIGAAPNGGYVQTSAYAQASGEPAPAPEQLPSGGYLWGGSTTAPAGAQAGVPAAEYSVAGSIPPPESVDPPPAGNLMGGLGLGMSAPIGVPPLGPLMSDKPILLLPDLPPEAVHTVFRVHQSITDEVGDDGPITSIGGFFPHTTDNGLWFFDGQFNILEDVDNPTEQTLNFGSNLGLGWRWIVPSMDSIAGLSFWYDLDRTRPDFVHQAGVSAELLGDLWQARINGYFPCGTNRLSTFGALGPAFYVNENIAFGQTRTDNLDMAGMDFELGRRLPGWLGNNGVSAYIGGYYYRADEAFNTFGVATRLEALISPNLSIDVKYSDDHLFKSQVGIGITWFLPAGKCKSCADTCCSEAYRLTEPVERNRTVVYASQTLNTTQLALNPATGTPIVVVHVDSAAPAGGNGTVNMPYNNLPAAQGGSAPNDIILVQAGSEFSGQSITLQNSQRFLGEGIPHTVDTVQEGTITLPTTSPGTVLPIIANSPGDAVTLASGNEVSGFTINNSGGEAIAGNGISGTTNINNVAINGGVSGINIQNSSTTATVTNVPIVGAATGISLSNNTGSFDFVGTQTVSGSTVNGVVLSGNSAPVTFDNLQLSANSGTGLSATNQTGTLTISAGAITAAAGTGVSINNSTTTAAPLAITLASVNAAGGANGILLNNAAGSFTVTGSGTTAGSGGTISDSTGAGVSIVGESGAVALNYMNITDPTGDGADVTNSAAAANVTLTGAQITLAGSQTGVNVNNNSGTFNLNNSTVTGGSTAATIVGSSGTNNLANFTSTNSHTGLNIHNNSGTTTATGTTTITGSTNEGVGIDNNTGAVSFSNLQIAATSGIGLESNGQSGTLTVSAGSVSNAGGQAVRILGPGAGVPLAVTLQSVNSTGGTNGIDIEQGAGTFTVTGTGTTAGSGGTISGAGGNGVQIANEIGAVSLNNMNVTNAGADGVNINQTQAAGSVTLAGMSISGSANDGVNVNNNAGTLNVNTTTITGGNEGVQVNNSSGTENFASLTVNNAKSGIVLQNNSGTVNATGTTTVSGSTNNGVRVDNGTGAVSFSNLQIAATSGTGLESTDQTGLLTISVGSVSNAHGVGVMINGTGATGAPLAITLQSVSSTAGANGIDLDHAGGSFAVTGSGTTAGSGGTINTSGSDGVLLNNEFGTVSLNNMNIASSGRNGVNDENPTSTSTVSLTGLDITGSNLDGIVASGNAGTLNVTNTTSNGANNYGLNLQNNTGTVNVSGSTINSNSLGGINVQNSSGAVNIASTSLTGDAGVGLGITGSSGTATITGLSVSGSPTGINLTNDTGAITFNGTTAVTGSTVNGVNISSNTGAISFNNLDVTATSGTGLNVATQTGAFTITAGSITADAGTAVSMNTVSNANVNLQTVNSTVATGSDDGITLAAVAGTFNVGSGTLAISGTGNAVSISSSSGINIGDMSISSNSSDAVVVNASNGVTIDNSFIESTAGNAITFLNTTGTVTASGNALVVAGSAAGIDVDEFANSSAATVAMNNNTIVGSGTDALGILVFDTSSFNNLYQINGNLIDLPGTGTSGIFLERFSGTSTISGTVNNNVTATTPFTEFTSAGTFIGTIIVNGAPAP